MTWTNTPMEKQQQQASKQTNQVIKTTKLFEYYHFYCFIKCWWLCCALKVHSLSICLIVWIGDMLADILRNPRPTMFFSPFLFFFRFGYYFVCLFVCLHLCKVSSKLTIFTSEQGKKFFNFGTFCMSWLVSSLLSFRLFFVFFKEFSSLFVEMERAVKLRPCYWHTYTPATHFKLLNSYPLCLQ